MSILDEFTRKKKAAALLILINILSKKVTHNILVYRQVQIIVAVICDLYISYVIEYKE